MLLCDFQAKLKRLNENLYVKTDERVKNGADFWISGIYFKKPKRVKLKHGTDLAEVHTSQQKYLLAKQAGELDPFVCGVCLNHIPEYDVFDLEMSQMLAPGWRKIVLRLVNQKFCTLERAKKVFECSSLGEHDYDKMNFFARLNHAKKLAKGDQNAQ